MKKTAKIRKVLEDVRNIIFPPVPDSMSHEVCHNVDLDQVEKRTFRCRTCDKTWFVTGDDKHLKATWIPSSK